ncbi:E3 ubiquitin-protein ligase RBBP6-like isoform 2-T6 [Amazona ochrocephala]
MSCIHYKFFSKLSYDTVAFSGFDISLCDLKCKIMRKEKLKAANSDLLISNAQTKEEYTEDALIPKNSLVVVKRIPAGGVKATRRTAVPAPQSRKIPGAASFRSRTEPVSRTPEANVNMRLFFAEQMNDESSASVSLAQLSKGGLQELKWKWFWNLDNGMAGFEFLVIRATEAFFESCTVS